MPEDFSLKCYADLIGQLIERGYREVDYPAAEADKPHLILRHDIDMSTEHAVTMAETETGIGVYSTYFVLLRSNLYNPFSSKGLHNLQRILELGHRIGLHFDASLYEADPASLEQACEKECDILEAFLGRRIEMVSFHRPVKSLLGRSGKIAGRPHAYEPRFFHEMGYCSDSRGAWHHGNPLQHEAVAQGRALQLLTHPIWWVGVQSESVMERLDSLAFNHLDYFRQDLAANCEPYRIAMVEASHNQRK